MNYGAVLQCFATQELLKGLGHEVEIIDYHNRAIVNKYSSRKYSLLHLPKRVWLWPSYLITSFFYKKRTKSFREFSSKYLSLSEQRYYQGEVFVLNGYDIILIGSDQLWNPEITNGFDDVYWGNFKRDAKTIVLSWSISMNYTPQKKEDMSLIESNLENFNGLSVRESGFKTFLLEQFNKNSVLTLDPTLVLESDKWNRLCAHWNDGEEYIAVYAVERATRLETLKVAQKLAIKTRLPIKYIKSDCDNEISQRAIQFAAPDGFLSLIRNATYVVTSSFHGTVFSIVFHKRLFALSSVFGKKNERINSLLEQIGLEKCAINQDETFESIEDISFTLADGRLAQLREGTLKFLSQYGI